MGLTIHYQLATKSNWTEAEVFARLEIIGDYARHLKCDHVGDVQPAHQWQEITDKLHKTGRGLAERYVPIHAVCGWLVPIEIGAGCEPFMLGLFQYPSHWRCQHGHSMTRLHPTKISADWQFSWFCKTQFAGRHGTAHFARCHKSVISLLDFCRKAGVTVTARDESGYWDNRDAAKLIKAVKQSEAMLAAFGGLLKDMAETKPDRKIKSPIFDYDNFEHLEHEGWQRYGKVLAPLTMK